MRLLLAAAALSIATGTVFATEPVGQAAAGRDLFRANCEECHGPNGEDGPGGDIRGLAMAQVARATRGIEQMPAFDLGEAELAAIVAYLKHLADQAANP